MCIQNDYSPMLRAGIKYFKSHFSGMTLNRFYLIGVKLDTSKHRKPALARWKTCDQKIKCIVGIQ